MTPEPTPGARERWNALTARLSVPPEAREAGLADLAREYAAPPRAYHSLAHAEAMLDLLDPFDVPERDAVELAVWFHDAVYDPRRDDNEARSAALAARTLGAWGLSPALAARVADLVLATKAHDAGDDAAKAWLLDADLAVLGGAPGEYDRYARAIREEYAWVPEAAFREGRARVLASFLARPSLFRTPELRDRFEAAARANLARERAALLSVE